MACVILYYDFDTGMRKRGHTMGFDSNDTSAMFLFSFPFFQPGLYCGTGVITHERASMIRKSTKFSAGNHLWTCLGGFDVFFSYGRGARVQSSGPGAFACGICLGISYIFPLYTDGPGRASQHERCNHGF